MPEKIVNSIRIRSDEYVNFSVTTKEVIILFGMFCCLLCLAVNTELLILVVACSQLSLMYMSWLYGISRIAQWMLYNVSANIAVAILKVSVVGGFRSPAKSGRRQWMKGEAWLDETKELGTIQYEMNAWLKRRGGGKVCEDQVFMKRSDDSFLHLHA